MSQTKAQIEKFQDALDEFLKNDYWKELYEMAPIGAKGWLESEFYASENEESLPDDAPDPDYHLYADRMKKKDWEWLIKYDCHHPLQKKHFEEMAAKADE